MLQETAGHDQEVMSSQYHTTYSVVQCFPLASYLRALNVTQVRDGLSLNL